MILIISSGFYDEFSGERMGPSASYLEVVIVPQIFIRLSGQRDLGLASQAVALVNDLTSSVLHKDSAVIATTIQFIPAEDWFIDGRSLPDLGKCAFHFEISITDETNTKMEKARYVMEVFQALAALRPDTSEVSYVHLVDARASAYGYGGRTQEWRYQRSAFQL